MSRPSNRAGVPAMRKDPFARTVVALLRPRGEQGGWVRVEDLAREVGVSKSTIRRQLDVLQSAGFPIEHHVDRGAPRRLALGVRSLVRGKPVEPDPNPDRWVDRDSLRAPPLWTDRRSPPMAPGHGLRSQGGTQCLT